MIERFGRLSKPVIKRVSGWSYSQKLWAILATAFVFRLPVIVMVLTSPTNAFQNDSGDYLDLGANLLSRGAFVAINGGAYLPETLRTPGYPVFLAAFQMFFGSQPVVPVVFAQVLLSCFTVVITALVARELFQSESISLIGGILVAINPNQIITSGFLLTETLFCFLMIGALWFALQSVKKESWGLAIAAGLLMSAAAYARHVGIIFAVVFAVYMFIRKPRIFYRTALPFFLVYYLTILPWMIRNESIEGRLTYTDQGIFNMRYYVLSSVEAHRLGISLKEARANIQELRDAMPGPNAGDGEGTSNALVVSYISQHPAEFVIYNSLDAAYGLLRPGYSYTLLFMGIRGGQDNPIRVMRYGLISEILSTIVSLPVLPFIAILYTTIFHYTVLLLTFYGLYLILRQKQWSLALLLFALPYLIIFLTGYQSQSRYRVPGDLLTEMLASVALVTIATAVKKWYERRQTRQVA